MAEIRYANIGDMCSDAKGLFDKRDYPGIRTLVETSEDIAKIAKFPHLFSGYIDDKMGTVITSAKDSGYPPIVLEAIRWLGQRSNVSSYDYRLAIERSQHTLRSKHESGPSGPWETGLEIDLEKAKEAHAQAIAAYDAKLAEYGGKTNVFPRQREGRLAPLYRAKDTISDWRHGKQYKRDVLGGLETDIEKKQRNVGSIEESIIRERETLASISAESELFKMYVASVAAIEIPELGQAIKRTS